MSALPAAPHASGISYVVNEGIALSWEEKNLQTLLSAAAKHAAGALRYTAGNVETARREVRVETGLEVGERLAFVDSRWLTVEEFERDPIVPTWTLQTLRLAERRRIELDWQDNERHRGRRFAPLAPNERTTFAMAVADVADLKTLGKLGELHGFSGPDQPEEDGIRACVHCGMCLPSCPTYRLTGQEMSSPRGRLWLMRSVAEGRLDLLDPIFDEQMYQCLNCRACEAVCPSGVHYGPLVEASRAQLEMHRPRPIHQRALRWVAMEWLFGDARRLRALVAGLRLYQRSGLDRLVRRTPILDLLKMRSLEALAPPVSSRSLVPGKERWVPPRPERTVFLFNGCVMGTVFADTNRAAARTMAYNGAAVELPVGQECCGALHVHAGIFEPARELARKNIDAFGDGDEPIVVTAAGCGAALKEYGHLLKDDPLYAERAKRFSARVRDVTEYLAAGELRPAVKPVPRRVTYQEPCHLAHAQRITAQPRTLLQHVPGLKLVEMRESSLCCGSAGIYNIIRREMADELGDRKAQNAIATEAEEVVTANPGCAMQLRASLARNGSHARVRHVVEVLDEAYGGAATMPAQTSETERTGTFRLPLLGLLAALLLIAWRLTPGRRRRDSGKG